MPTIKCPTCRHSGSTGLPWGPAGSPGPDILVKPGNLAGSSKSLLYCRACGTAFLRGPVGKGRPAPAGMWEAFVAHMQPDIDASDGAMVLYGRR